MNNRPVNRKTLPLVLCLLCIPAFILCAQESAQESGDSFGFGFGFDGDSTERETGSGITISGKISAEFTGYVKEFGSAEKIKNAELGDIFSGTLNFLAAGKTADGIINLKIKPELSSDASPINIDEAYVRLYLGPVDLEAGLRKLTWGRADSFGPLDVINPLDYTDLSAMGNPRDIKRARPMLHVSWNLGSFSKLEGVFVPWFAGNDYALADRWAPAQITGLPAAAENYLNGFLPSLAYPPISLLPSDILAIKDAFGTWIDKYDPASFFPKTDTLQYAQAGLRFTTTIGVSDFGIQYYFGRLPRPAYTVAIDPLGLFAQAMDPPFDPDKIDFSKIDILVDYNYYHQIGIDYAQVIAGFNLRAEAGVNITDDLSGDDGAVYNPQVIWSLGFDRDLLWGINLNLQGNGAVRLMYSKIGSDPLTDTEAGVDRTSTRITAILSRSFFRDELELKATALWGIEDKDFLIMPAIIWSKDSVTVEFSGGFFGGDKAGELGQYHDNGYLKAVLGYRF